ncbi:glycosyltransferase [uncultured Roseibium sp.]|uniref:glycosyltransferase family protein n=1 Tax=uncultured Roseibium sp. TaxID=1936171 RepID=UPI0025917B61|nr:glycosyltransferase [uncultured Roseibium sp.]
MTGSNNAVFLFNLLQDVNILRPLVLLAKQAALKPMLLVSNHFQVRDKTRQWALELESIGATTGSDIHIYDDIAGALEFLPPQGGVLFAGSESSLPAHWQTHDVMKAVPKNYTRITLQHGFECVGFLQSRDHIKAHGLGITFAADIICGWLEAGKLTSITPSQRQKLVVTGPSTLMQMRCASAIGKPQQRGIVCENLHSVRFNVAGDFKMDFMAVFDAYCDALAARGERVTLRPHPGGQYVLKNNVLLRPNVTLNNNPIYKVDLTQYSYGISAPSSVLIDMILAGIPVAVWHDSGSKMDIGNYEGLTEVSSMQDWLDFSVEAREHPARFLEIQDRFLENIKMITNSKTVQSRFMALLKSLTGSRPNNVPGLKARTAQRRILFVANGILPTLQLSFIKPLASMVAEGKVQTEFLTEQMLSKNFKKKTMDPAAKSWILDRLEAFQPDYVVFCRYSGPHADFIVDYARQKNTPALFHIDDDLLSIPIDIGERKYNTHNSPNRLATVRYLLDHADLVYASTDRLKKRLEELGAKAPVEAGKIYCAGHVLRPAENRPVMKFGYMASADHAHNLERILPAIINVLRRNKDVTFELFGSIPKPGALEEFGERVSTVPPIADYESFLQEFAKQEWDIGICPLSPISFNLMKANTKWIEYSSVGLAVVASRNSVYDTCCADGCGFLAETVEEWQEALEKLIRNPSFRYEQVLRAQKKLRAEYTLDGLRSQVFDMLDLSYENMSKDDKLAH